MTDNQINFRISSELKEQFKAKVQKSGTDVTTVLTEWISKFVSGVEVKPTSGCIDNLDDIDQLIAIKVEQRLETFISELTVLKSKLSELEENRQNYEQLRKQVEVMQKSFLEISQSLSTIADTRTKFSSEFERLNEKLQQLELLYHQQNSKGTKNHSSSKKGFQHL